MPIPFYRPSLAPPAVFKDHQLPYHQANILSRLFFHWITPILKVGYSRPLEADGKSMRDHVPDNNENQIVTEQLRSVAADTRTRMPRCKSVA